MLLRLSVTLFLLLLLSCSPWIAHSKYNKYRLPVDLTLVKKTTAASLGAYCLDGSLPAYHIHKGFGIGARSWILHFEPTIVVAIGSSLLVILEIFVLKIPRCCFNNRINVSLPHCFRIFRRGGIFGAGLVVLLVNHRRVYVSGLKMLVGAPASGLMLEARESLSYHNNL